MAQEEEVEKRENDEKQQEYNNRQYDLQYELKLKWEDLQQQHPHRATGKMSETTTILSAEDFKLQWEDLRQKRLILLAETNETTSPSLSVEPSGTSTAQTTATSTKRMANPGAFAIPGSSRRQQSQASVERQDNDPLVLVQASEVLGDCGINWSFSSKCSSGNEMLSSKHCKILVVRMLFLSTYENQRYLFHPVESRRRFWYWWVYLQP